MALFGKKALRIEVVDGIDIESGVTLSGEKVTIGTGPADNLRLGESDVVPAQVTFQRRGADWDYFVSDRGRTNVAGGHPRAGRLRAGQQFRLGATARLAVVRADAPPPTAEEAAEKPKVPIALALPLLGLVVLGIFFAMNQLRSEEDSEPLLATTRWFTRAAPLDAALDTCLASATGMDPTPVARTAPDWAFRNWLRETDPATGTATEARAAMLAQIGEAISRAHFLHDAGRNEDAAALYRRLENVIPLGNRDCPILAATRRDLAVLELMGNRN